MNNSSEDLLRLIRQCDSEISQLQQIIKCSQERRVGHIATLQKKIREKDFTIGDAIADYCFVHFGVYEVGDAMIAVLRSLQKNIQSSPSELILFLVESSWQDDLECRYSNGLPGMDLKHPQYLETIWVLGRLSGDTSEGMIFDSKKGIIKWPMIRWVECVAHNDEIASFDVKNFKNKWCLDLGYGLPVVYHQCMLLDWLLKSNHACVIGVGRDEIFQRLRKATNKDFEDIVHFMEGKLKGMEAGKS